MSKFIALLVALIVFANISFVDAKSFKVKGYTKKNGTYVQPYYKSSPNRTKIDNFSTKGNYNPYSGKTGKVNIWR